MSEPERFALGEWRITREPRRLIIDGFYRHPEAVRARALAASPWQPRRWFPGVCATADVADEELRARVRSSIDWIAPTVQIASDSEAFGRAMFSMITKQDAELAPGQAGQPHADAHADVAGLVYLNLPAQCRGGTGFYRHRQTALDHWPRRVGEIMAILDEREPPVDECGRRALRQRLSERLFRPPPGPPAYIRESTETWELTRLVDMRFNRAVFYDAKLFHSNYTRDDWFGATPETRRLTQTFFWRLESR